MAERGRGKGGRDESLKALRCIADWWVGGGIGGKLKFIVSSSSTNFWLRFFATDTFVTNRFYIRVSPTSTS
jgi:hypothetical protein